MPDAPQDPTLIHYREYQRHTLTACGVDYEQENQLATVQLGQVTCFACRNSRPFHLAQQEWKRESLPQRVAPPPLTPPIKLSGVMANHEQMQEMYAEAIRRGEPAPRYTHDCSDCEFLGSEITVLDGSWHDLYYCHGPEEGNVLVRHGNEGPNYKSGYSAAKNDPLLAMAVVRAIHKGLVKANALHHL